MPMTFERSVLTQTIVTQLRGVNDEITYEALAKRAEAPIARVKSALSSALRILASERLEFGTIRGVGLKRLDEHGKAGALKRDKRRIAKAAGRGEKRAARIDLEKLSPVEQLQVTTDRAVFGLVRAHAMVAPPKAVEPTAAPTIASQNIVKLAKQK